MCTAQKICPTASTLPSLLGRVPLVLAHLPLVPLLALDPLPPRLASEGLALLELGLLCRVDLDEPVLLELLVGALVSPLALPLALLLVVLDVAALLPRLGLDALLGGEPLPLGRLLGGREGLLARKGRLLRGQRQQHARGSGLDRARRQELVDKCLRAVPGQARQRALQVRLVELYWVRVIGEK